MGIRVERQAGSNRPVRSACLVAGCTCKDARIVSPRRVAFFASWARGHGETADRRIDPDPGWRSLFAPAPRYAPAPVLAPATVLVRMANRPRPFDP